MGSCAFGGSSCIDVKSQIAGIDVGIVLAEFLFESIPLAGVVFEVHVDADAVATEKDGEGVGDSLRIERREEGRRKGEERRERGKRRDTHDEQHKKTQSEGVGDPQSVMEVFCVVHNIIYNV